MANIILPATAFRPTSARKQQAIRNTLIEDVPQVSSRRVAPPQLKTRPNMASPLSEGFPTPRAHGTGVPLEDIVESPASSDSESDVLSLWSKRSSQSEFDEMYDMSGSDSDEFPIKLSGSVKKRVDTGRRSRFPSVVIPDVSEWPTIEKLKSAVTPLSPPIKIDIAPTTLAELQRRNLTVPVTSSAPSLDGSATDSELALSSCPSTPDIETASVDENAWEAPVQLDPTAISMLRNMHLEEDEEQQQQETVLEIPEEAASEMREIVDSPGFMLKLNTSSTTPATSEDVEDQLSALSIPTPGGFFSSLDGLARRTWAGEEVAPTTSTASEFYNVPWRTSGPPTSTAASFYGVPWADRPSNPIEHTISMASPVSEAPTTARKIVFSPTETIVEVNEIDETYDTQLKEKAEVNFDRTQMWLSMQNDYMQTLCSDEEDVINSFRDIDGAVPTTPEQQTGPSFDVASPASKKSVRFAATEEQPKSDRRISPIHDGTFWEGWRHQKRSARARDVFQHRQARTEAEHVRRTSCSAQHANQLKGKFEITSADRPTPSRPISTMLPLASEDAQKEIIAAAEREREALEQLKPSAWHLQAQKEMNGGQLLTSPIVRSFKGRKDVRILDLAGQASCGWAWSVAMEHPAAAVFTTVFSDAEAHVAGSSFEGPNNHTVVAAPKLWQLPFESNSFDVISARNLYANLKLHKPQGEVADEWDLTLQECQRILKPGGFLEFDLLDAELIHAQNSCQALSVEFAFNLKTRGYDACAGKSFLPRLKRAGFDSIKRAWIVLPVADVVPRFVDNGKTAGTSGPERIIAVDGSVLNFEPPLTGSTRDVRAITGLIGARNWETWMLKLNAEMGRNEGRCLEAVSKALVEGGKCNAAWRSLVGWAKKEA